MSRAKLVGRTPPSPPAMPGVYRLETVASVNIQEAHRLVVDALLRCIEEGYALGWLSYVTGENGDPDTSLTGRARALRDRLATTQPGTAPDAQTKGEQA